MLVLDEPTAHLDLINRLEIMTLLREISQEKEKAVLVVTHDLDIAFTTSNIVRVAGLLTDARRRGEPSGMATTDSQAWTGLSRPRLTTAGERWVRRPRPRGP